MLGWAVRRLLALGLLALSLAGCQQRPSLCAGIFTFEGVEPPGLQRDAYDTIMQFAAIDDTVETDPGRSSATQLAIRGTGDRCERFGSSFLRSDMPEFRGLRYRSESR